MLGDGLALLSSVAGVAYLTCAKAVRPHISVTLFMFLVMFFGSGCIFIYLILTGVPITWSRDPHTGLLGWFTMENNHFLIMLHSTSSRKKIVCALLNAREREYSFYWLQLDEGMFIFFSLHSRILDSVWLQSRSFAISWERWVSGK
jgi:hypothetical protein